MPLSEYYSRYRRMIDVAVVATVAHLGYGILNQSAIPPYVSMRGWTEFIGVIYGASLVSETLCKSVAGSLADLIGLRPVYMIATAAGAISAFLWTVVGRLWMVMPIRLVDGGASAGAWTVTIVAIGGSVAAGSRTTAMGVFTLTYLGGLALGPLIGGYLNDSTHSKLTSFYAASAFFLLATVLAYFLIPTHAESGAAGSAPTRSRASLASQVWLGLRAFPDFLVIAFVAFLSIGLVVPAIKLFAMQELRMTETDYGLLALPVALVLAAAALGSGRLANLWGKDRSVQVGISLSAVGLYLVPLIHRPAELGVLAAVVGLGFVVGMPAWLALVSDMSDARVRGSVIGALGTGQGLGVLVGVVLGGFLYATVPIHVRGLRLDSHYTPFMASAVGLTICAVLCFIFIREGTGRYVRVPGAEE